MTDQFAERLAATQRHLEWATKTYEDATQQRNEAILEAAQAGRTYEWIAAQLGLSPTRVSRIAYGLGAPSRAPGGRPRTSDHA